MNGELKIKKINYFDLSVVISLFAGSLIIITLFVLRYGILEYTIAITLGAVLILGFMLPRHVNKGIRSTRARESKRKEFKKWGFYSRDREGPWINYINFPLIKKTNFAKNKIFYSEWLIIQHGEITVNPGPSVVDLKSKTVKYDHSTMRAYAWDGCSPKIWFYWFILIGTPDLWHKKQEIRQLSYPSNKPPIIKIWQLAHHASLVHDALYQYLGEHGISKHETDLLFYQMLCESGLYKIVAKIYHIAVICFGGYGIDKHYRANNSDLSYIK